MKEREQQKLLIHHKHRSLVLPPKELSFSTGKVPLLGTTVVWLGYKQNHDSITTKSITSEKEFEGVKRTMEIASTEASTPTKLQDKVKLLFPEEVIFIVVVLFVLAAISSMTCSGIVINISHRKQLPNSKIRRAQRLTIKDMMRSSKETHTQLHVTRNLDKFWQILFSIHSKHEPIQDRERFNNLPLCLDYLK